MYLPADTPQSIYIIINNLMKKGMYLPADTPQSIYIVAPNLE
jgi:hypothetical protein